MSVLDIFRGIKAQQMAECRLGNPLRDPDAIERRQSLFATLTGGRGFRVPKKAPGVDRREAKRNARQHMLDRIAKERADEQAKARADEQAKRERADRLFLGLVR